ncbi:CPBP family intramembrane glutamic endopeptidase [Lactiplantibacillus carotarum]|uniref:CPBP family intramembrane glutamic endopeptidase n=1 Tax=Lactiplantibacillus carotarum TaxID=2993456 RepID=UPI00298F04C9|nr:CPBP family intramembrane glutamic endopeptidase [Lactiplantibacillus carotarum]
MITKTFRTLTSIFAGIGLFLFIQIPILADGYWDWWGESRANVNLPAHWAAFLILTMFVSGIVWWLYRVHFQRQPIFKGLRVKSVLRTLLVATLIVIIQIALNFIFSAHTENETNEIVALINSPLGVMTLLGSNFVSPFLEEILFRGIIQSYLTTHLTIIPSLILTNLLFALGHGYGISNTLGMFITGVGLSYLAVSTKHLGVAILGHISVNWLVTIINVVAQ